MVETCELITLRRYVLIAVKMYILNRREKNEAKWSSSKMDVHLSFWKEHLPPGSAVDKTSSSLFVSVIMLGNSCRDPGMFKIMVAPNKSGSSTRRALGHLFNHSLHKQFTGSIRWSDLEQTIMSDNLLVSNWHQIHRRTNHVYEDAVVLHLIQFLSYSNRLFYT